MRKADNLTMFQCRFSENPRTLDAYPGLYLFYIRLFVYMNTIKMHGMNNIKFTGNIYCGLWQMDEWNRKCFVDPATSDSFRAVILQICSSSKQNKVGTVNKIIVVLRKRHLFASGQWSSIGQ